MKETVDMDTLRKGYEKLTPEDKEKALKVLNKIGIDLSQPNKNLTGTRVSGFMFMNRIYEADSHKSVFIQLAEIVLK